MLTAKYYPIAIWMAVGHNFHSLTKLIGVQDKSLVWSAPVAIVVVNVALKPEILDPQGRAIVGALGRVGLSGVANVRQGKQFVLNIDGDIDEAKLDQIHEIASTLLSNPVIEDFTVQVRP
jgi:phosphoribosylformylglycinamidine synthase PurS subunit